MDSGIFERIQEKIDEESKIREDLKAIVQKLEKEGRACQSIVSQIHNTPLSQFATVICDPYMSHFDDQTATLAKLKDKASQYPYYKYNGLWTRELQNVLHCFLLIRWLTFERLVAFEQVGEALNVPSLPKNQEGFQITLEEYLYAIASVAEELARYAPNAVVLGDLDVPLKVSKFIKDVHSGFQLLNLKNDGLRRKSDGLKYSVKKIEDVVYDLKLRGLLPQPTETSAAV